MQRNEHFYASVMIKISWNFLFCRSNRAMLHFKDQSVTNLHRGRPETLLSLRGQQDTIYWHLVVV